MKILSKNESAMVAGGQNVSIPQAAFECYKKLLDKYYLIAVDQKSNNVVIPKIEIEKCFKMLEPTHSSAETTIDTKPQATEVKSDL